MRRAVGVARVQQTQQTQQRMADYGAQITAERVAHIADALEHLTQQLRTLSAKYKDDIKHDPLVRARFRQIADSLGVDLLSSKRNVFAGALGLGDFYYRLASRLVEVCMREEAYCGGYVPLLRVMQYVQQSYDAAAAAAAAAAASSDKDKKSKAGKAERKRTTLSVEDVLTALGKLRVLGSGYSVVEINGVQYIQTAAADSTAGSDATALLGVVHALRDKQVQAAVARQHAAAAAAAASAAASSTPTTSDTAAPPRRRVGAAYVLAARNTTTTTTMTTSPAADSDASLFQAQCVAVTEAQLCEALPWPLHRLRTALQRAVQSGAAWVDRNDDYDTTVSLQQQQQQQYLQYASSSDKEQAWLLRVVYWFMPELNAADDDGRDGAVGGLRTDDMRHCGPLLSLLTRCRGGSVSVAASTRTRAAATTTTASPWQPSVRRGACALACDGRCCSTTATSSAARTTSLQQQQPHDGDGEWLRNATYDTTTTRSAPWHTAQLLRLVPQLRRAQQSLCDAADVLLEDRRVLYRDDVFAAVMAAAPARQLIATMLLSPLSSSQQQQADEGHVVLTAALLDTLQQCWLPVFASCAGGDGAARQQTQQRDAHATLYQLLLCSTLVRSDAEVQLVLRTALAHDDTQPRDHTTGNTSDSDEATVVDAALYRCVLLALPYITLPASRADGTDSSQHAHTAAAAPPSPSSSSPSSRARVQLGELTSYYMGHALARHRKAQDKAITARANTTADVRIVDEVLWGLHLTLLATVRVAPKLMELWWQELLAFCDADAAHKRTRTTTATTTTTSAATPGQRTTAAPLPYTAIHAVLSWSAALGDVQWSTTVFHTATARGMTTLPRHLCAGGTADATATECSALAPGALTQPSSSATVQAVQLRLLAKLMATVRALRSDGGVRALVVRDVQRLVAPAALLQHAPWGVVNDILSGLSVPSAMQLLQRAAAARAHAHKRSRSSNNSNNNKDNDKSTTHVTEAVVPFALWAALLRRCAREHHLDEAGTLYRFVLQLLAQHTARGLCDRHDAAQHRRELLEIMLRMYATLSPPDCASALSLFVEQCVLPRAHHRRDDDGSSSSSSAGGGGGAHAVDTTDDAQAPWVRADAMLYSLLIRAADSRNAAMMLFLEGCASGVGLSAELFDALVNARPYATVAALSQRLPHDYVASPLDAQLRVPDDADAHARRAEALRARGKPLYDSTGDSIG